MDKTMSRWNYIVWVGATPDYYVNYEDAKRAYDEWIDEGYDDVHLYSSDSKLIYSEETKKNG
jgi:hypothetical protein